MYCVIQLSLDIITQLLRNINSSHNNREQNILFSHAAQISRHTAQRLPCFHLKSTMLSTFVWTRSHRRTCIIASIKKEICVCTCARVWAHKSANWSSLADLAFDNHRFLLLDCLFATALGAASLARRAHTARIRYLLACNMVPNVSPLDSSRVSLHHDLISLTLTLSSYLAMSYN